MKSVADVCFLIHLRPFTCFLGGYIVSILYVVSTENFYYLAKGSIHIKGLTNLVKPINGDKLSFLTKKRSKF
jgi:hypothetical protein